MISTYTAKYLKTDSGYMGQLVEWPEVVTEGRTIEECRKKKFRLEAHFWNNFLSKFDICRSRDAISSNIWKNQVFISSGKVGITRFIQMK